jgi:hypothetical protein
VIDENVFYLDRDNELPVGGDNIGKWSMRQPHRQRRWVGNSRKIYQPSLSAPDAQAREAQHVSAIVLDGRPAIAGDDPNGSLVYRMSSAFVFCGGRVQASFHLAQANDEAVIQAWAEDNKGPGATEPLTLWQGCGPGARRADIEIDKALDPTHGRPEYEFWVRIRLISHSAPTAATLTDLSIRGDIMVSPIFLPRLRLGENKVVYTDESGPERKVRLAYHWRETTATKPLPAPKLLYPPDRQTIHDETVTYRWRPVEGAVAYHLQVCRDPAMRWPYRPSLDVVYEGAEYRVPFWGIYSLDTDYYWRVRSQNDKGIWGGWSSIRTFRWVGPCAPTDVELTRAEDEFTLSWKPNPRGRYPVAYEVYGSDIKGFSVSKEPYEIPTLGTVPANYLGRTTSTEMVVAGHPAVAAVPADVENPKNLNRCYYRVVAVDGDGIHSGCSECAEMPHPYIWTQPVTACRIGQHYRYQPRVIQSLGDLQHRYEKPGCTFWEREELCFTLEKGPQWLDIDPQSGLTSGTPPSGAAGTHPVCIRLTASFEERTGKDKFTKDFPARSCQQAFDLVVSD